jgi:hypothetical protein
MSVFSCAGYTHPDGEAGVKIETRFLDNPFTYEPMTKIVRWTIVGALRSTGGSGAMQTRINGMESKYAAGTSFSTTATFTANGHTHTLPVGDFAGLKCVAFGWETGPWKMHTELSNRRGYYIVLQSESRVSQGLLGYKAEWQTIGFGGPLFRYLPSIGGVPEKQQLQAQTTIKQVQRGVIVHQTTQPTNPSIAGAREDQISADSMVNYISPLKLNEGYGVEWRYVFEFTSAATETPPAGMFDPPT